MTVVREFDEERDKQTSLMKRLLQKARYCSLPKLCNYLLLLFSLVKKRNTTVAVPTMKLLSYVMCVIWPDTFSNRDQRLNISYLKLSSK